MCNMHTSYILYALRTQENVGFAALVGLFLMFWGFLTNKGKMLYQVILKDHWRQLGIPCINTWYNVMNPSSKRVLGIRIGSVFRFLGSGIMLIIFKFPIAQFFLVEMCYEILNWNIKYHMVLYSFITTRCFIFR